MEATETHPDRSGAVWVTATGALLLFAAAVTFVAVRWDDLASWQKFAALVGVTQVLLVAGWLGRRRVPATAAAIWSLGVVLVPLDAWTIAAAGDGTWQRGLFAGGALAALVIPLARRWWDTAALRWATVLAVPLAVAGTAAVAGSVPTAAVVAGLGVAATWTGRRVEGRAWLGLGLLGGLAVAVEPVLSPGRGVLAELGLAGTPWLAVAAGAVGLVGAVVEGARTRRPEWVWILGVAGLADVLVGFVDRGLGIEGALLAAAATFLVVELVGLATVRDGFWSPITSVIAAISEVLVGIALAVGIFAGPVNLSEALELGWTLATALVVVALAWVVADVRSSASEGRLRPWRDLFTGSESIVASVGVFACSWLVMWTAPVGDGWRAGLILAVGTLWLLTNRAGAVVLGTLSVCIGSLWIGVLAFEWSFVGLVLLAGVVGIGAARRATTVEAVVVTLLGTAVMFVWQVIWAFTAGLGEDRGLWLQLDAVVVALVAMGALATVGRRSVWAAVPPWLLALLALPATTVGLERTGFAPLLSIVTVVAVLAAWSAIAIRRMWAVPGGFAALASPLLAAISLHLAGLEGAALGLGVAVGAFVLVGIALVSPRITRPFLVGAAGSHLLLGALGCLDDPGALGVVVAMTGVLLAVVSLLERLDVFVFNGGMLVVLGTWQALRGYDVTTPEAYLAPLAAFLAVGGWYVRRTWHVSSWLADAPAIAVLGGGALAVRLDGGAGWHALVAGAVALVAVALGGWRRLAGPLFGGSLLLAAVVINETVRVTAGVPTWIWLALGGTALLGAGLSMEARGLGPIESGRRLVDVIDERFE